LRILLQDLINLHHCQQYKACDWNQEWEDISLTCPLPSLPSHEIFRDVHSSELVSFKLKPGHSMNDRVHNSSSAYHKCHHSNDKPDLRL
jgi:hypothetical protein